MGESVTATFLFTDLVGSTELRSALGDDAADVVHARLDGLIAAAVVSSGGDVVKRLGDGVMAVFSSAGGAVACAESISRAVENDRLEEPSLQVRVGVNSGEVSHEGGDYTGLPVVIARRLCDLASGGEILVSGVVRSLVGGRGGAQFAAVGRKGLKGIDHPVEVWRVGSVGEPTSEAETPISFPPTLERLAGARLVGREDAWSLLDSVFEQVPGGSRRVVLLAGEPGIGKSALAAVWARRAAEQGAVVLAGRTPSEAVTSYQPFIEILRYVIVSRPSVMEHIPGASELARLVPDLADRLSLPPGVQGDPGTQRYVLFESFVSLVHRLAEETPIVLVLDDLHWADAASLSLFEHVCSHPDQAPVLILGTYRDTDLSRAHPLSRVLGELRRERRFQRVELKGLDRNLVGELVASRAGGEASGRTIDEIYAETEGNPFFVEEVVSHLIETGVLDASGEWQGDSTIEELGIPEGVRDVIGRRLEQLDADTNQTLTTAAVIGRDFDLGLLETVTDTGLDTLEDQMEQAMGSGLVDEAQEPGQFAFSHALIRQTLYEELSSTRRARLHRTVAKALSEREAAPGELAHHWSGANDLPKALHTSIEAAAAAEGVYAFDEARRHLDLALELWDDVGDPEALTGIDLAEVYHRTAEVSHLTEGGARSVELIDRAVELVGSTDPARAGFLHTKRAGFLWWQGEGEAAHAGAEEATRLIPSQPASAERARALAVLARLRSLAGRVEQAREAAEEAIAVAREVGDRSTEGHALNTLGSLRAAQGEVDEGIANIEEAKRIAVEENILDDQLRAYNNLSILLLRSGRVREAADEAWAGYQFATRFGVRPFGFFLRGNAANFRLHLGEWDEVDQMITLESFEEVKAPGNIYKADASLAIRRGDFAAARRITELMLDRSRHSTDPQDIGISHFSSAELALWEERWEEALAHAAEGLKRMEGSQDAWFTSWLPPMGLRAVYCLVAEAPERPREWLEAGRQLAQTAEEASAFALPHVSANAATSAALWAGIQGVSDPDLWQRAVQLWESLSHPFEAAWARVDQAETLMRLGRVDEAHSLLDQAEETVRRLGARPLAGRIAKLRQRI